MKSYSQTEIEKDIFEVKVDDIVYEVYRVKPRLFRIVKQGKFLFNTSAFSIEKVSEMLLRIDFDYDKTRQ